MIKVIAVLSLLLILISGFSYTEHLNLKASKLEVATQLDVINSLNKEIKDKTDRLEILTNMSNTIITDTRVSDSSFTSLTDKLNKIDCTPTREVKSNANTTQIIPSSSVSEYYDVLHSAYRLQNED